MSYVYLYFQNYLNGAGKQFGREIEAGKNIVSTLYADKKINEAAKKAKDKLKETFQETVKKNLDSANTQLNKKNQLTEEEYLKILDDFQKNRLQKAASEMTKNIDFSNLSGQKFNGDPEDIKKNITELSTIIQSLENITKISEKNSPQILTNSLINNIKVAKKRETKEKRMKALREKYRNKLDIPSSVIIKGNEVDANEDIKKIAGNINLLKDIQKRFELNGIQDFDTESEIINSTLRSTYYVLRRVLGLVSEEELAKLAKGSADSVLKKSLSKNKYISIQTETIGSKTTNHVVNTTDIKFTLKIDPKDVSKSGGSISINLPGASVKRTSLGGSGKNAEIKLKSGATFKRFFNSEAFQDHAYHFANFLAARQQPNDTLKKKNYEKNFFSIVKLNMLPYALAGTLQEDDFAYYFIVNDEIYTVADMFDGVEGKALADMVKLERYTKMIKEAEGFNIMKEEDAKTTSQLATERSIEVFNKIQNMKINIALTWKLGGKGSIKK